MARTWTGSVSKDWNTAGNWSPAQLPGILDDVSIGSTANGPIVSTTGTAENVTVNQGATLAITAGASSATLNLTGSLLNDGTITLTAQQSAPANLLIGGTSSTNTGKIILSDSAFNFLDANHAGTFTNSGTISGAGNFGILYSCTLINKGVINATETNTPLELNRFNNGGPFSAINSGLIEDTGSGGLVIWGSTIDSSSGGSIQANGANAKVDLNGATLIGGTLSTQGGGIIEAVGLSSVLQDLTNLGSVKINKLTGLSLHGTIKNDGTISLFGDSSTAALGIIADTTLSGVGSVVLSDSINNVIQSVSSSAAFTNSTNTISGAGTFRSMTLTNSGVISAIYSDNALTLATTHTITNNGTLKAAGGTLIINDAVAGTGTQLITSGGTLALNGGSQEDTVFSGPGSLQLGKSYSGSISGFSTGDSVDLTYVSSSNFGSGPNNLHAIWTENSANSGGTLAIVDPVRGATPVATVNFSGVHSLTDFAITDDGHFHPLVTISTAPSSHVISPAADSTVIVSDPNADIQFPTNGTATVELTSPAIFKGTIEGFSAGDVLILDGMHVMDATEIGSNLQLVTDQGTLRIPVTLAVATDIIAVASTGHGDKITTAPHGGGLAIPNVWYTGATTALTDQQRTLIDTALKQIVIPEYAKYLAANAKLNIQIQFADLGGGNNAPVAANFSPVFVAVGKDGTRTVYESGAQYKVSHNGGDPWSAKDIYQSPLPNYVKLQNDPTSGAKPDTIIIINTNIDALKNVSFGINKPDGSFDQRSAVAEKDLIANILAHELGHALGFNTLRDGNTGLLPQDKETMFDKYTQQDASGTLSFVGELAKALFGGPVPLVDSGEGTHFYPGDDFQRGNSNDLMTPSSTGKQFLAPSSLFWEIEKDIDPFVYATIAIPAGGTLELPAQISANALVGFSPAVGVVSTLKIDSPSTFSGTISGIAAGDVIDLVHTLVSGASFTGTTLTINLISGGSLNYQVTNSTPGLQFVIQSDGSGGSDLVASSSGAGVSVTTIQNDYSAIARSALPSAQAASVAAAINAGTQTENQYINSLLAQVANTTVPAVAVEGSMYGVVGSSAEITTLVTQFLPAQVANAIQNGYNPLVYASEALGLVFAFGDENGGTGFAGKFGPSNASLPNTTAGDASFAAAAASAIFGSAATADTPGAIQTFVANWKAFYSIHGVIGIPNATADLIDLAARGAAWGDAVGIALANNLGLLKGQVINFLEDAAQGTAVYSASLASQPNHTPFQGGSLIFSSTPMVGVSTHLDASLI